MTGAMGLRAQAVIVAVGVSLTVSTAWLLDLPRGDTASLLGLAGGGALAAAVFGSLVLRSMRTATLRAQGVAVALVSVLGTGVGVVLAAYAMFVSSHDLGALLVVLLASSTAAVLMAIRFGSRISTASRDLEDLTRRLGDGDLIMVGDVPVAHELHRLAEELHLASERLDDARRKERAMESARRELIAWVSHDLRTPLAGIRAMVEALEDGVVDDAADVARYHATMRRETDRLAMLVDDLFELSRIEAGALDLRLEEVTLGDIVAEAVAGAMPVATAKGVRLRGENGGDDPALRVAPAELTRVVRNLLDNAIRHTPAGSDVEVCCGVLDGNATVSVADACGGIPDDDLGRVFDLAFRGDDARGSGGGGGGLGLAIAHGLVGAHNGTIRVENRGLGCRFTVELPLEGPDSVSTFGSMPTRR
ncbi:sensor histidine kinase [Actinospongicola halichondriae]|uniref:sensor histidine kinase n=1 Tax=Actinospongicola halichondriae TaxID=3236844 RepID=UPI003D379374